MNVLFVASECAPFIKTGGLADVIGAVPKAITAMGASVKVLIPAYPALESLVKKGKTVHTFKHFFGGKGCIVSVKAPKPNDIDLLLLDAPHLYDRPGNIYVDAANHDWPDNHLRFGALSYAGAELALHGVNSWQPDVVNVHDWQAGLVPVYLRQSGKAAPPVVVTIHNIAFQGLFSADKLAELGIKTEFFTPDGIEFYGMLSYLKAAVAYADMITTVSPTYARELLTPEFGMGLEGLLQSRQSHLKGITNGIDIEVWNPADDKTIAKTYTTRSLKSKAVNREEVQRQFALSKDSEGPLFCVISRLTHQKGLDVLLDCLPHLVGNGAQLALLGTGEKELEVAFIKAASDYAGSVGVIIGYDEMLSHQLQAGSDAILIPSRFEPCGLTQLYGLRYGTIPVVARTGGLADTVIDANEAAITANCATGVLFTPVNESTLKDAITKTCCLYERPDVWCAMVRKGMNHPVGWDTSATAYLQVYESLLPPNSKITA